jgi:hypothetical protein
MLHGLEGRRIAVFAGEEGGALKSALEGAGAEVELLSDGRSRSDEVWHGGRYAAVAVGSGAGGAQESRIVQLVREFLVSSKPVVVVGNGTALLERAGGTREDALIVSEDVRADARQVVQMLAQRLEEDRVDEMSDLSFPASDPPSISPGSIGPDHSRDSGAR